MPRSPSGEPAAPEEDGNHGSELDEEEGRLGEGRAGRLGREEEPPGRPSLERMELLKPGDVGDVDVAVLAVCVPEDAAPLARAVPAAEDDVRIAAPGRTINAQTISTIGNTQTARSGFGGRCIAVPDLAKYLMARRTLRKACQAVAR